MTAGQTAAAAITVTGATPSDQGREIDLAVDLGLELLKIDPAGDVLVVQAATTWTGRTASQTL